MSYAKARNDFEYLESLVELDDWVEIQGDTLSLMQEPSKAKAKEFYERCIGLWAMEHRNSNDWPRRAKHILERYGY